MIEPVAMDPTTTPLGTKAWSVSTLQSATRSLRMGLPPSLVRFCRRFGGPDLDALRILGRRELENDVAECGVEHPFEPGAVSRPRVVGKVDHDELAGKRLGAPRDPHLPVDVLLVEGMLSHSRLPTRSTPTRNAEMTAASSSSSVPHRKRSVSGSSRSYFSVIPVTISRIVGGASTVA